MMPVLLSSRQKLFVKISALQFSAVARLAKTAMIETAETVLKYMMAVAGRSLVVLLGSVEGKSVWSLLCSCGSVEGEKCVFASV